MMIPKAKMLHKSINVLEPFQAKNSQLINKKKEEEKQNVKCDIEHFHLI